MTLVFNNSWMSKIEIYKVGKGPVRISKVE